MSEPVFLKPAQVDQETFEREFRSGLFSLRELAKRFGMCPKNGHVQIKRHADKLGWEQDLTTKIQAQAEALVQRDAAVARRNAQRKAEDRETPSAINEREVVEANANVVFNIRIRHRKDIERGMVVMAKLMGELEAQGDHIEDLKQLGNLMFSPNEQGKDRLNEIYHAVIGLPERMKTGKTWTDAFKTLVALEREAYGIADVGEKPKGLEDLTEEELDAKLAQLIERNSRTA